MEKTTLNLKTVMLDLHLNEMKNPALLTKEIKKKLRDENPNASQFEMMDLEYAESPPMYFGEALKNLIAQSKPEKTEDAADIFAWIRTLKQSLMKDKGELQVTKEEMKELLSLMDKIPKEMVDAMISGQVYAFLKEAETKFYAS